MIWFERDTEMKRETEVVLFGIHKTDYKKAQSINFSVEGKHKKPIIPFRGLRYSILCWKIPAIMLAYLFGLAYIAAFITFKVASYYFV